MLGSRLKLFRTAGGISLQALAERTGNRVTAQEIRNYERNESMPGSGALIALADALGVSVHDLVGDREIVLEALGFKDKTIIESPKRFENFILRALAEGTVSEAKAAELITVSVRELDCLMKEAVALETEMTQ